MAITKNIQKNRKTKAISVSLDEYLIVKAKQLADDGEFSSVSSVVAVALTEFFVRHDLPSDNIGAKLAKLLDSSEEGKALIRSILQESFASSEVPVVVEEIIE